MINGEERNEIPYSTYYENIVVILAPADSYTYEVVGTYDRSIDRISISAETRKLAHQRISVR